MSKKMTGKWVLLIVAFIVSCLIWYMVITNDDPRVNISLGNIEVELVNGDELHEKGLAYYVEENASIGVRVNVVQERGWLVKADDIRLTADLSGVTEERTVIPVKSKVVGNQSIIGNNYKLSAGSITVRTEKLVEKAVPVVIQTEGDPEDDCVAGPCVPDDETVTVRVPESVYDLVDSAGAVVDISGRTADYEGEVKLLFYDENGKEIDCEEQQILPEKDKISVKISIGVTKKIEIASLSGTGVCSEGYRCTGIEADKQSVTVIGPEEVLGSLETVSVPAAQINLDGRTESFEVAVSLNDCLPESVTVFEPEENSMQISVTIEKLEKKTFTISSSNIQIKNLSASLKAVIRSEQISVVIQALPEELEKLETDQIQLALNLSGLREGTYQVEADYSLSGTEGEYEIVSLEKATVIISGP
ncbi:MAG: YbbR-like domain-containing protein [Lachnospiraceae bacterium]